MKKPKKPKIKHRVANSYNRWVTARVWSYDDKVHEQSMSVQTCLFCYDSYPYDPHKRFHIRNRFCVQCRSKVSFKKWLLIAKFFGLFEDSLDKNEATSNTDIWHTPQFVNGIYMCIRFQKTREYLIETITALSNMALLGTPIELSQLFEEYDELQGVKKKRRHGR